MLQIKIKTNTLDIFNYTEEDKKIIDTVNENIGEFQTCESVEIYAEFCYDINLFKVTIKGLVYCIDKQNKKQKYSYDKYNIKFTLSNRVITKLTYLE